MSALQDRVLAALAKDTGDGYAVYIETIAARADMTRREARIAVRALARKGYARLERLFDESTGLTAGSGYGITREGKRAYESTPAQEVTTDKDSHLGERDDD